MSFGKNCAACHGASAQGSGNVPSLVSEAVRRASDGELFWYITRGDVENGMPSWQQLPEAERWRVIAYLRALAAGSAAAAPTSAPANTVVPAASTSAGPFTDFRHESPGTVHRITVADLPAPYATASANNGPHLVHRPEGAWPKAPAGFAVQQYATDLERPRLIRTAPNGDVFAALSAAGRIVVFRGMTADGKAESSHTYIEGLREPFGIAFYPPGPQPQWIYIADTDAVLRVPYDDGDLRARAAPERVAALPDGGGHWTRDIQFSPDGKTMYVSVGSRSNVSDPDTTPEEKDRADILAFAPDGSARRVFASGIRNAVGLAVQPGTGELWCSVNERDGLGDNLVPDYITHVRDGGFYGWPWWYIGAHQDPRHAGKHPELKDRTLVPDVLLQPHNASLELTFYEGAQFPGEYRGDIFAAEHGSWNKSVRAGYEVIRVPLHGSGHASGEYEDFLTGFVTETGEVWGRPVGVAVAKDGSLLVSDDGSGTIWRVSHTGSSTPK